MVRHRVGRRRKRGERERISMQKFRVVYVRLRACTCVCACMRVWCVLVCGGSVTCASGGCTCSCVLVEREERAGGGQGLTVVRAG